MAKEKFYSAGTQSFDVKGQDAGSDHIVLNITEKDPNGVILDKKKKSKRASSGNIFLDIYYGINNYFIEHSTVDVKSKATFFHLLGVMLNSGIPMVRALKALEAQMEDSPRLKMVAKDLVENVEGGSSLSDAMIVYRDVFSDQEIGMIQSGEISGQLVGVLANLAKDTEKAYEIRAKVKSAMTYPIVIMILLVGVIIAMMVFVVPQLSDLFASTGEQLPLITRIVVGISDFMLEQGLLLAATVLTLILVLMVLKRTDFGKYLFDKFKLKIPLFGKILQKAYLSRFSRSISNLLDSGVSIVKTMEITANSIGNEVYRKRILLAREDIKQGIPLAENLTESELFPPMLVNMVDVGEKTAQLGEVTDKIANFYESEVDNAVNSLSKILEPVILIVIGLTVGAVVAAIMLPIMQLSNIAGSL